MSVEKMLETIEQDLRKTLETQFVGKPYKPEEMKSVVIKFMLDLKD